MRTRMPSRIIVNTQQVLYKYYLLPISSCRIYQLLFYLSAQLLFFLGTTSLQLPVVLVGFSCVPLLFGKNHGFSGCRLICSEFLTIKANQEFF